MISAVKLYWGNWTQIFPPSMKTGACKWSTSRWRWRLSGLFLLPGAHLKSVSLHRHQLTLLANLKLVAPGPVRNGLRPHKVVAVLHHLRENLVVGLGTEESCDGQSVSQSVSRLSTNMTGQDVPVRENRVRCSQCTDRFQKLLVVLLTLQLVLAAESHDSDRGATESPEETSGERERKKSRSGLRLLRRRPSCLTSSFL